MDRNMSTTFTSTVCPANRSTKSGVTMGAMTVVHAVMPTDSATSPFARYVMTLELVPPGARAHEDHAYGQLGRQLEHHRQQKRQHRHDDELSQDAHDDGFGS